MNKLSKEMALKIIKMIDTRLYCVAKDYEQHLINDDEFSSTSNVLNELQTKIQSFIEIEESLTEE